MRSQHNKRHQITDEPAHFFNPLKLVNKIKNHPLVRFLFNNSRIAKKALFLVV